MEKERLYLLGHPVAHSKSPVMHNALYRALGLEWEYVLFDAQTPEAAQAFLEKRDFFGINITTPYKPLAYKNADIKAASAKLAQGANVLARKDTSLIAYNMDGEGCVSYLEHKGFAFKDSVVVVCGTGPTALAILHSAACAGAKKVVLMGRDKERTHQVLHSYLKEFNGLAHATIELPALHEGHRSFRATYEETTFSFGSYHTATKIIAEADVVINATPLGMKKGDLPPFDTALLHEQQTVFDVVYAQGETALIADARARGCNAYQGAGMLVAQAVATDRVFFELAGLDFALSDDEMFALMARAAGFEC